MPLPRPRPPPPLMDELVEEILLRLPPDKPASLVRAALVSKRWCRLVSDAGFRRRFRDFHRTPPIIGYLWDLEIIDHVVRFLPAPSSGLSLADHRDMRVRDARHGRVLLQACGKKYYGCPYSGFIVWDPITDVQIKLPDAPSLKHLQSWTVAVLCAAGVACDHLHCRGGPFMVVVVGTTREKLFSYVYSSESDMWSGPNLSPCGDVDITWARSAVVGNSVYFISGNDGGDRILEYDLQTRQVAIIELPELEEPLGELTSTEDGRLGYIDVQGYKVSLWSMCKTNEIYRWELNKVIDLEKLPLHGIRSTEPCLVGVAEGLDVIFLAERDKFVAVDLKSEKTTMVHGGFRDHPRVVVSPYVNFYTPVSANTSCRNSRHRQGIPGTDKGSEAEDTRMLATARRHSIVWQH
ncbi:hypothetical protein EJB05_13961, partial [Eragrostis curvula]